MPAPKTVSKHSDLLNRLVLERNTMEEIGRIEVLWMYPDAHRVLGFVCKSGILGAHKRAFNLAQIHTLGTDSILVNSGPTETDANRVKQLESLVHCEVWSEAGKRVGKIVDYTFDLRTGAIHAYLLLLADGWTGVLGSIYQLPPRKILSFGSRRVLVAESAIPGLKVYREGLQQRVTGAGEFLKENYTEATQSVHKWTEQAQSLKEQAQGRLTAWADRAKQKAQQLAQQAQEQAQLLNEQLQEETQQFSERARETGSTVLGRVQEEVRDFGHTLNEEAKGWSDQAKEQWEGLREEFHPAQREDHSASAKTSAPETNSDDWDDWNDWDEDDGITESSSPGVSYAASAESPVREATGGQNQVDGSADPANGSPVSPEAAQWDEDEWEDEWETPAQPTHNPTITHSARNQFTEDTEAGPGGFNQQSQNLTDTAASQPPIETSFGSPFSGEEGISEQPVEPSPAIADPSMDVSPTNPQEPDPQPAEMPITVVEVAPDVAESTPKQDAAENPEVLKSAEVSKMPANRELLPESGADGSPPIQSGLAESWPESFDEAWVDEPASVAPSVIPEEDLEDDDPWV